MGEQCKIKTVLLLLLVFCTIAKTHSPHSTANKTQPTESTSVCCPNCILTGGLNDRSGLQGNESDIREQITISAKTTTISGISGRTDTVFIQEGSQSDKDAGNEERPSTGADDGYEDSALPLTTESWPTTPQGSTSFASLSRSLDDQDSSFNNMSSGAPIFADSIDSKASLMAAESPSPTEADDDPFSAWESVYHKSHSHPDYSISISHSSSSSSIKMSLPSAVSVTTVISTMHHPMTDTVTIPGLVTATPTTCIAAGETCLCHDNMCINGLANSLRTLTATSGASTAASTSNDIAPSNPVMRVPPVAIIAPVAFLAFVILFLFVPCCLRRISPTVATRFNRICPLDDFYGGVAAIWSRLSLTRRRNRDVRARATSRTAYNEATGDGLVNGTTRTISSSEDDHNFSTTTTLTALPPIESNAANDDDEKAGVVGKWRQNQEDKLWVAQLRAIGEGRLAMTREYARTVERARSDELRRMREQQNSSGQ